MTDHTLVYQTDVMIQGGRYNIQVFSRDDGRHFAQTHFDDSDIIISDGASVEDVLEKHRKLIPLAVTSRRIMSELRPFSRRSRKYRP